MSAPSRPRRLRRTEAIRAMVRETRLSADSLILPLFARSGSKIRTPIAAMPGQFQWSVDLLAEECRSVADLGIRAVLLFGVSERKDEQASCAYAPEGVVQRAIRAIKTAAPHLSVITDVCLCAYTSHGHCGVFRQAPAAKRLTNAKRRTKTGGKPSSGAEKTVAIDEPRTLEILGKVAVSHAQAGADLVGPSDMMDGNVAAVRQALDRAGFDATGILAYAVKYASAMYGPFREAALSAPAFGDRRSYQMDPANAVEAMREARLDAEQGSDILLVKPELSYLDVIWRLSQAFDLPVAAYNVSGEYSMVKAAVARGWVVERAAWMEQLLSLSRAGADLLITYWAKDAAQALKRGAA